MFLNALLFYFYFPFVRFLGANLVAGTLGLGARLFHFGTWWPKKIIKNNAS